jgi:hypothetical protein
MRAITDTKSKTKRKPSSEWNRRTNTVPLTERGAFQIADAANYMGVSISSVRRLITRGLIRRLPSLRHIVIAKAECDRFLNQKQEIEKLAA